MRRESSREERSVVMVVMATGSYKRFLPPLITSARQHLQGLSKVVVLSDASPVVEDVAWGLWGRFDWPISALSLYRAVTSHRHLICDYDSVLLIDADMLIVDDIALPAQEGLVATLHPYYVDAPPTEFTYERNPASDFAIPFGEGNHYYCGAVIAGDTRSLLSAASELADRIDRELAHGRIPLWHDESAWNRYCLENPPAVVWGAEYCRPESHSLDGAKIIALDKPEVLSRQIAAGQPKTGQKFQQAAKAFKAQSARIRRVLRNT